MALMIFKPSRIEEIDGVKRVLSKHAQWYLSDTSKDFHIKWGVITKENLKPGKIEMQNEVFYIVPTLPVDGIKAMRRKAQIITRKDAGFIIGYCGLTKNSVVVESGGGSGGATLILAGVCKNVFTYEIDNENIELIKENLNTHKVDNVTLQNADFYNDKITNHNAQMVLLDLPEPWRAMNNVTKTLVLGGYVVAYTPTIIQAQQFVEELPNNYLFERTKEIIDRDWKMKGKAIRPVSAAIGHTAFLTFARRIE